MTGWRDQALTSFARKVTGFALSGLLCFWSLTILSQDSLQYYQEQGMIGLSVGSDSSAYYFQQAARLAAAQNNPKQQALALNRLGLTYKNQGKLRLATTTFRKSLQIRTAQNDQSGMASVHNNLGNTFKAAGRYDSALVHTLQSLRLREALNETEKIGRSYLNLGNLYQLMEEPEKALEYYQQAETLAEEQNDEKRLILSLYNQAAVYSQLGDFDKALDLYQQCNQQQIQLNDPLMKARINNGCGVIYQQQQELEQAAEFFELSLEILEEIEAPEDLAAVYLNLGNVLLLQKQVDAARDAFYRSLEVAREADLTGAQAEAHYSLYGLYAQEKYWEAALGHFKHYTDLQQQLKDAESARAFAEIKEQFESEQQQRLIALQQASIEQKTLENQTLIGGLILLGLLGLVGFIAYRQRTRNRELQAEKQATKDQQRITDLVREKEVESMEAMLTGQAQERQRIARDLHDQLGGIMATVKLHFNSLEDAVSTLPEKDQQQFDKADEILDLACKEVRVIAHDMASGLLNQFGLEGALEETVRALQQHANLEVELHLALSDERLDDALELDLFRTIQELVSNVLRHAQASELNIQLTRNPDGLNVLIEDNGIGFDPNQINSRGMGLKSISNRVYKHGGTSTIDSTPDHGTTVVIDIPLAS